MFADTGAVVVSDSSSLPTSGGYPGQAWYNTGGSEFQSHDFMVRMIMASHVSASLVQVVAVYGGGPSAPATVDVQPMVGQIDGLARVTQHGVVHGLPVFRLQGGSAAVIVDPVVGDKGMLVACDRDISAVKATGAFSPPGSRRQNSWADGCYFGGFINQAPTTYVSVTPEGVDIQTGGTITIAASNMTLDGTGNLAVNGEVTAKATGQSVSLSGHRHGTTGSQAASTRTPTPGT